MSVGGHEAAAASIANKLQAPSRAAACDVGYARLVSNRNEADLDVTELVHVMLDDDETDDVSIYMEGLRYPQRLAAERASRLGKSIVVYDQRRCCRCRDAVSWPEGSRARG